MARKQKDLIILSFAYLASRLVYLTRYPIFNDEATYLRYGQIMTTVPWERWYSLAHTGKQPLLYWIYGLSMQLFSDPLLAGRLVTVVIGLTTVWAVYYLVCLLASEKSARIASLFIIISPLFVFFDRLALVDNALAAVFAWLLVLLVKIQKQNVLRMSIFLGVLVGVSLWIKSIGFLFALATLMEIVYIWYSQKKTFSLDSALLVFVGVAALISLPLFLRPEAARMMEMAHDYTFTPAELIAGQFGNIGSNTINAVLVSIGYVSPLIVLAFFLSLRSSLTVGRRIVVFSWIVVLSVVLVFGKNIHGRYLLFTTIPMIVLSSLFLATRKMLLSITIGSMAALSTILIVDPPTFFHLYPPWMVFRTESLQYIDGWSSGYGVKEALAAIDVDRKGEHATIAVRWDTGNPEDAIFVYDFGNSSLVTRYLDSRLPKDARVILVGAKATRTYFVTRKGQYGGFANILDPIAVFSKPMGTEKVELFRVRGL